MSVQPVQRLVDAMLDLVLKEHPGVEFSAVVPAQETLLLPKHSDKLWRGAGYYRGHVYRDCLVYDGAMDDFVALIPLDADAPAYYGMLATGEITTTPPLIQGSEDGNETAGT